MLEVFINLMDETVSSGGWNVFAAIMSAVAATASAVCAVVVGVTQHRKQKNDMRISAYLSLVETLSDMRACADSIDVGEVPPFDLYDMDRRISIDIRYVSAYGFFFKKKEVETQMGQRKDDLAYRICSLSEDFKVIYKSAKAAIKANKDSAEYKLLKLRCENFFEAENQLNKELGWLLKKN